MLTPSIFTSVTNTYLPEPHASLLNGIIFGTNLKVTKEFYEYLKIVGLLHIVVLSGSNISLLTAIISKSLFFLSKQLSILITILIIVFFIIFVGAQAPIIRAGFMGVLTLVAIIYGRKYTALYVLLLSAIFVALFWPKWLTTLSFQLSYGASLGIILFSPKKKMNYFINQFFLSLSAQIFTAPLIFLKFKTVSLISPISNICIAWTIAPLMVFGFLTAFLGKINFYLGLIPSYICYGLLTYVVWIIECLARFPWAYLRF